MPDRLEYAARSGYRATEWPRGAADNVEQAVTLGGRAPGLHIQVRVDWIGLTPD